MTDATDATIFDAEALRDIRQRLRRERQARVGILRNPNHPPMPPTRRASLTGRWLNMRSSRRASSAPAGGDGRGPVTAASTPKGVPSAPAVAAVSPADAVRIGDDGRVLSVDLASLMAAVDDHAGPRTETQRASDRTAPRAPFAAEYRADVTPQRRSTDPGYRQPPRPSVLSAEAWLDDPAETDWQGRDVAESGGHRDDQTRRSGWRIVLRLVVAMLGGMLLAVLILLALLGPPP